MTTSIFLYVCSSRLSKHCLKYFSTLYTGTITLTNALIFNLPIFLSFLPEFHPIFRGQECHGSQLLLQQLWLRPQWKRLLKSPHLRRSIRFFQYAQGVLSKPSSTPYFPSRWSWSTITTLLAMLQASPIVISSAQVIEQLWFMKTFSPILHRAFSVHFM